MPELPEVETTRRGLEPHLTGRRIARVAVRHRGLRWKVRADLPRLLIGRTIRRLDRRSKYLLIECDGGWLIVHLGMSGSLRVVPADLPPGKHDHIDIVLDSGKALRLTDPRRFGAVLWCEGDVAQHELLRGLGPEPLGSEFDGGYLYRATRRRSAAIKLVIMDSHVVVGVGNIYASEALFRAGIKPQLAANRLSKPRGEKLVQAIRQTLREAIKKGGSSLRDFVGSDGEPGYFQQHYFVYGRAGEPCRVCGSTIRQVKQGQRSSFYCPACQK